MTLAFLWDIYVTMFPGCRVCYCEGSIDRLLHLGAGGGWRQAQEERMGNNIIIDGFLIVGPSPHNPGWDESKVSNCPGFPGIEGIYRSIGLAGQMNVTLNKGEMGEIKARPASRHSTRVSNFHDHLRAD